MMAVCPTMVRPVLDRERGGADQDEGDHAAVRQYHTGSEVIERLVGFSLTSTLLGFHTVVWQIRDVFLIAFIFGTIPERRS